MMYITVDKLKALGLGFNLQTHIEVHGMMILNEKELLGNALIKGDTLQDKAKSIGGTVMTETELEQFKIQGGN